MSQAKLTPKPTATVAPESAFLDGFIPAGMLKDPTVGIIAFLAILIVILKIFKPINKESIADARWASRKEINSANRKCRRNAAMKELTNPILWIAEPVGSAYPRLEDLHKTEGLTCFSNAAQAIAIIGASGYGKTKTILDPLIKASIERGDSIMLVDPKFPEQASQIIAYARNCGYQIKVFAPGESFPESDSFNLFDLFVGVEHPALEAISACATILGNVNAKEGNPAKGDPFFDENAPKIAACCMLLANWISRELKDPLLNTIPFAYSLLSAKGLIKRLWHNLADIPFDAQILASSILKATSEKTEGSLITTAEKIFSYFTLAALIPACGMPGNFPGFFPDEPLKLSGKQLLIFGLDQDLPSVISPIICAAVETICRYNLNSARPRSNNLLLCMDEFAALYLPAIKAMLAEKRSMGLITLLALQTPSQFDEKYGKGSAKGFMDRFSSTIFMNPNSYEAASEISKLLGDKQIITFNRNRSINNGKGGGGSSSGTSESPHKVPLMSPQKILRMPAGTVIIRNAAVATVKRKLESEDQAFVNQEEKIPYKKRFKVNHTAIKKEEVFASKQYKKMAASAAAANKHKIKSDKELRQMLEDHRVIIDQFLPLPPKEEAPPKAQPGKFVMLSQAIEKVRSNGYFVTGDTTDRKVTVPKHFSDDLTTAECQQLLTNEGIKYAEFANH